MIEVLLCELSVVDLSIRPENRLPYLNFSNDNSLAQVGKDDPVRV